MLTYAEAKEMMSRAKNGRRKLENNTWLEERACHTCLADGRNDAWKEYHLHAPANDCSECKAPHEHHEYAPSYAIRLHGTDVVTLHPDNTYTLNSGGWRTVTTKDRMSHYAPVAVFSRKGQWFVAAHQSAGGWDFDNAVPFEDGMVVSIAGVRSGSGKGICKMKIIRKVTPTNHFVTKKRLLNYYGQFRVDSRQVDRLIRDGEVFVGIPEDGGENDGIEIEPVTGRYVIVEYYLGGDRGES